MPDMGVKTWGSGLIVAAIVTAVTASGAPVVQAAEAQTKAPARPVSKPWQPSYDLPASLADYYTATTPPAAPDKLVGRWACELPIRIYFAAAPGVDKRGMLKQFEYPVEYLRDLGYTVTFVREAEYRTDYLTPVTPGNVLVIAPLSAADTKYLHKWDVRAYTDAPTSHGAIRTAKITLDAARGLSSDILLHELGHALGLKHKQNTVMAEAATDSVSFDAAETAAIDCR